ncbi:ATP-dependent endonuclease [Flavipsychrobacter stenotrophus]|uniref:ATP-dependent endonuclease n=1 Tax=Flavipsychrobacter stenotrophus TaxID=2077091 RepID=A0A2S7SQS4_9BACT|nr:ATP-dependent endonuclease [Flavipsychrobacter stenotrophus]PQJ08916.1 ATP-dependent endonuclease [Flavipsychrobacter stenotrophus]
MKIKKIKISNYRLLKDMTIDLEDILSLVIGKNNCGKTSFLSLLERFLNIENANKFTFDDLNLVSQHELKKIIDDSEAEPNLEDFSINLKLYIEYNEGDNLTNVSLIMLDLDPDVKTAILSFEYSLSEEHFHKLKADFSAFKTTIDKYLAKKFEEEKVPEKSRKKLKEEVHRKKDIIYFLKKHHGDYFKIQKYALEFNNETNYIDLQKEKVQIEKIINFKRIKAKRDVANESGFSRESDKTLSKMSSKYYDKISNAENELENIAQLQNELSETDEKLNKVYGELFEHVINKVRKFGGVKKDESKLMIISSLEEKNLLSNNTTVMYKHNDEHSLPEDYNGLGYMNLIAMIFEIEVLLNDFKKTKIKDEVPADINLLFIEEPEAHTHPQMQYVFIKNIKSILSDASYGLDDGIRFNLQTIITTHSSCITTECDFDDIKYFYRKNINSVIAKNLKNLQEEYTAEDPKDYQFLKQYLTLNRTELFFADKAIFIEGDTERILVPAIMKKLDIECSDMTQIPLLSQNISIVEVGAYSHVFEKFIDFLGIKTLIITDLDSCKKVTATEKDGTVKTTKDGKEKELIEKCRVVEGSLTTNSALNFFYALKVFNDYSRLTIKTLKKKGGKWAKDASGQLFIAYQMPELEYNARSFEDSFIHLNREFINKHKDNFISLKNRKYFDDATIDAYSLADECIDKKTVFALDTLFHSDEKFKNWQIPGYIKDGLLWLKN